MGIVLDNLRYTTAKDFLDSFSSRKYYIFASSLTDQDVSGNNDRSSRLFVEKTIFGKEILPEDATFMVRKIMWTPGVVYSPYDDTTDLSSSLFYVISEPDSESGNYAVFKCISNNNSAASVDKPIYSSSLVSQNFILRTADGYIWKYLYSITNSVARAYSTTNLFPVATNRTVVNNAVRGIDRIVITNPTTNFGYDSRTGTIISVAASSTGGLRTITLNAGTSDPNNDYFRINGYYKGYTFYATSPDGVTSRKYIIADSGVNANQRFFVSVSNYVNGDITNDAWNYTITPTVEIIGDGTGASALSTVTAGRITDVVMLNSGEGYSRSRARIVAPTIGFNTGDPTSGDVACALRVVLPPPAIYDAKAGHGGNPAAELRARHVAILVQLDRADELVIPSTNMYSKVGIMRDPIFNSGFPHVFDNRIKIELASVSQLNVGDVVTQPSTDFRGIVHTIDDINSIIYVTEFYGPYNQNSNSFYLSSIVPLDDTQPLTTPAGRVEIQTDGIVYPTYQMGSGELLYVTEFEPIERSENLAEQFKFIISF
jgi:hypothetical protein